MELTQGINVDCSINERCCPSFSHHYWDQEVEKTCKLQSRGAEWSANAYKWPQGLLLMDTEFQTWLHDLKVK